MPGVRQLSFVRHSYLKFDCSKSFDMELNDELEPIRPSIVEVVVDPFEPPMPPKVSAEQALHFAEALVKGQPAGGKIALTFFRDKLSELFK